MTYQDFRIVPVRFEGGPRRGDLNELDYAEHELQEMLDQEWTACGSAPASRCPRQAAAIKI